MDESIQPLRRARFGPFEVNFSLRQLSKRGNRIKVHEQPLQVLEMLVARPGELVTREEICQKLWPSGTFVDFDNGLNSAVNRLRDVLGDSAEAPRYVETIPRYGYRFIAPVEKLDGLAPPASGTGSESERQKPDTAFQQPPAGSMAHTQTPPAPRWAAIGRWSSRHKYLLGASAIVAVVVAGALPFSGRRTHALTDRDTIVLADFANSTGDAVFDETLKQGLSIQLTQSPFLNLLSDQKIDETLKLMERSPGDRLVGDVARELCRRSGSKAVLAGSIASLGSEYVIGLKAQSCTSGEILAQELVQAARKEDVLKALDTAATRLRTKLGESLSTVQKFDTPLEQATTPSLEALQAFSRGRETLSRKNDFPAAVPFLQRAIRLDPNFAMAYATLGTTYFQLGQTSLGAENTRKAYELRERVSERERFYIESHYLQFSTGNLAKAQQVYELWAQTYPRDFYPAGNLTGVYDALGQYDKALEEAREAFRLDPANQIFYDNLTWAYLFLNRLDEAGAAATEALARGVESSAPREVLYEIAFLKNDSAGMTQQVSGAAGNTGLEVDLLLEEAKTAAYAGRLRKALELSRRALAAAKHADEKETGAGYERSEALWEALFGNVAEARQHAAAVLGLSSERDAQLIAALALALAGDVARVQALADDLAKRFPENTVVQFIFLPTLRAQIALNRKDAPRAIETLRAVAAYELGLPGGLYPAYVLGDAYLAGHQGSEAAVEFQKILDHRGIVTNDTIGAVAHLGLARAYALAGQTTQAPEAGNYRAKARAAYQDFLTLWKDADPDIPILRAAKSEAAKLQ